MELEFTGPIFFWRGPAPFHFVAVPDEECAQLAATASMISYGWGMIPVTARIGRTTWTTSLWPKDKRYIVPVKAAVRSAEDLDLDDQVTVRLSLAI